ncbi:MAG: hypothetical protein ACRDS1_15390 [Pseudonocardiaceae bacterium]
MSIPDAPPAGEVPKATSLPRRIATAAAMFLLATAFALASAATATAAPAAMAGHTLSSPADGGAYCGGQQPGSCPGWPGWHNPGAPSPAGQPLAARCGGEVPGVCPYPK